jgi:hypothetical protein
MKAIIPSLVVVISLLAASVFAADTKGETATVQGVVFIADADGGRSVMPGAKVSLNGPANRETEAAVGGLCMVALSKSRRQSNSENRTLAAVQVRQEPTSSPEPQKESALAGRSHIAVILANNLHDGVSFGSAIPQVGAPRFCSEPFWEHKKRVLYESSLSSTD